MHRHRYRFGAALQLAVVAIALSALDALAGRLLHAHTDPSALFVGVGAFLVVRGSADLPAPHAAAARGLVYAVLHLACFRGAAAVLVGWNDSLPWVLTRDALIVALIAGAVGGILGDRAPRIPQSTGRAYVARAG